MIVVSALVGGILGGIIGPMIVKFVEHRLRRDADQEQIRFAGIYERKANIMSDTYDELYQLQSALKAWTSPFSFGEEDMKEKRMITARAFNSASANFHGKSLWFDSVSTAQIEQLLDKIKDLITRFDRIPDTGFLHPPQVKEHLARETDWMSEWDKINNEAINATQEMMDQVKKEFQTFLGIE